MTQKEYDEFDNNYKKARASLLNREKLT